MAVGPGAAGGVHYACGIRRTLGRGAHRRRRRSPDLARIPVATPAARIADELAVPPRAGFARSLGVVKRSDRSARTKAASPSKGPFGEEPQRRAIRFQELREERQNHSWYMGDDIARTTQPVEAQVVRRECEAGLTSQGLP